MVNTLERIDPVQLAKIKDLQLLARSVVQGALSGLHRSPFFGSSIEFAQYRPYVQGDDPRFVDWSLYARTDRLHIKQFHDETNLRCMLVLDCSASMQYGSRGITKFQYARILTACLATLLLQQKDEMGLFGFHRDKEVYVPTRSSPNHYRRIMVDLANMEPQNETNIALALFNLAELMKHRGLIILVSDLLHPADRFLDQLKLLRARKHEIIIFQISDPTEQTFSFDRSVTLIDAESGQEQFAIPDLIREQYLENRNIHFLEIRKTCLSTQIEYKEFTTAEPLDHALRYFIENRNRLMQETRGRRNRMVKGGA
ncbi:MAG: DUF58 domain-containing protein [bacterium]|jgi:uncharacterized protein (DUF58 family)